MASSFEFKVKFKFRVAPPTTPDSLSGNKESAESACHCVEHICRRPSLASTAAGAWDCGAAFFHRRPGGLCIRPPMGACGASEIRTLLVCRRLQFRRSRYGSPTRHFKCSPIMIYREIPLVPPLPKGEDEHHSGAASIAPSSMRVPSSGRRGLPSLTMWMGMMFSLQAIDFGIFVWCFPPYRTAAGARWTFGDKGGQMFERSEFLSARQTSAGRREPAQRARRWGALLLLTHFGQAKRVRRRRGRNPRNLVGSVCPGRSGRKIFRPYAGQGGRPQGAPLQNFVGRFRFRG